MFTSHFYKYFVLNSIIVYFFTQAIFMLSIYTSQQSLLDPNDLLFTFFLCCTLLDELVGMFYASKHFHKLYIWLTGTDFIIDKRAIDMYTATGKVTTKVDVEVQELERWRCGDFTISDSDESFPLGLLFVGCQPNIIPLNNSRGGKEKKKEKNKNDKNKRN
ncbi:hypothetical protein ACJX0J_014620, partial [Zea mays]